MISEKRILDILGNLYGAAKSGSSEDWLSVYKEIATLLSSGPGGLTAFVPRTMNFEVIATTIGNEYLKAYEDYYQFVSPFRETLIKLKPGE